MMEQDIAAVCEQELLLAYNTDLSSSRSEALSYYNAVPGEVKPGWSDLVSTDVRDAVESSVAEIMSAIGDDPLAWFAPLTADDDEQAEKETWLVQHSLFSQNRGREALEQAIRDSVLQRYGIIKIWMDERTKNTTKTFMGVTSDAIPMLAQVEAPSTAEITKMDAGEEDGTFDVTVSYKMLARDMRVIALAPEDFAWSKDLRTCWLNDARFLAERAYYTRTQLVTMGVSQEMADKAPTSWGSTTEDLERRGNDSNTQPAARREDDPIECYWCWLRNEDESRERVLFCRPGMVLLEAETYPFHPYAGGVAVIRPHRFDGISLADRLGDLQDTKTELLRQLATQAKQGSKGRFAMRNRGADPDTIKNEALNPIIVTNGAPSDNIMPLPMVDVTSQLLSALQWLDGVRREQGGASIDMTRPEINAAYMTAHAAEREFSFREMQAEHMLRTIGETIVRSMYLLAHATLREYSPGSISTSDKEKNWISQDPQQWPQRTRVVLEMGATLGTRQRRMSALGALMQDQMQVFSGGGQGIMVTLDNLYQARINWARAAGLLNGERYWQDPASQEAQKTAQAQQQAQAQQAQQAEQMAKMQMQMQHALIQIEQQKIAVNEQKNAIDALDNKQQVQKDYFAELVKLVNIEVTKPGAKNDDTIDTAESIAEARTAAPVEARGEAD